jgi:hypothetical protein
MVYYIIFPLNASSSLKCPAALSNKRVNKRKFIKNCVEADIGANHRAGWHI